MIKTSDWSHIGISRVDVVDAVESHGYVLVVINANVHTIGVGLRANQIPILLIFLIDGFPDIGCWPTVADSRRLDTFDDMHEIVTLLTRYPYTCSSAILIDKVGSWSFCFIDEVGPFREQLIRASLNAHDRTFVSREDIEKPCLIFELDADWKLLIKWSVADVYLLFDIFEVIWNVVALVIGSIIHYLCNFSPHIWSNAAAWKIWETEAIIVLDWSEIACKEVCVCLNLGGEHCNWDCEKYEDLWVHNMK